MKRLLMGAVIVGAIVGQLAAQRGRTGHAGGGAHFAGGQHYPGGVVVPPLGDAVPALGASTLSWHDHSVRGGGASHWGNTGSSYGYGYGGYGPDYGYGGIFDPFYANRYAEASPSPQPGVVVLMPQAEAPPPPPAPPLRPETREYNWPESGAVSSDTTFSIVSKDGQVQSAAAVWVQDNALCYFTPDGNKGRIPISSIDRQATRQRNAEKQLKLWLPPEA